MGGDYGPSVAVPAALKSLSIHPELSLVLVGNEAEIEPHLQGLPQNIKERLQVFHTLVQMENTSKPESVLRKFKNSSMYLAVSMVKDGTAHACVSAGNTGALLLTGRHLLKTIPGITKPAIIASIPAPISGRPCYILDVGANINTNAEQLLEFAVMGSVLASALNGIKSPRIGLLNIGSEEHKGTKQVRLAAHLLENTTALNYIGFIEGNEIFNGKVDVVVCDGFAGNITIKTSAGVVKVIEELLKERAFRNWSTRLTALLAMPFLSPLRAEINPARFNGASLIGLQGIIVKSHGNAQYEGFFHAIEQAFKEVADHVPELIGRRMTQFLEHRNTVKSLLP